MNKEFSKSWIRMRLPHDNKARSNLLTSHANIKNHNLLDIGCGSGNFLIWCLNNKLIFKECFLVDSNQRLLDDIKSNIRNNIQKYSIKTRANKKDFIICNKDTVISKINVKRSNISNIHKYIHSSSIVSFSALLDLMSKKSIDSILNFLTDENIFFFSLCFDGIIKWNPTHKYDKYILRFFNENQMTNKSMGMALGYKSIDYLKRRADKLNCKFKTCKSPWIVTNNSLPNKKFLQRYLLDIRKALFNMDGIEKSILREWYEFRHQSIINNKVLLYVGHQDILLKK